MRLFLGRGRVLPVIQGTSFRFCAQRSSPAMEEEKEEEVPRTRDIPRRHRNLYRLTLREETEESLRDFLPVKPMVPHGWSLHHQPGMNKFELHKRVEVRECGVEHMHVIALLERKKFEGTYRMDNGERDEQEYLNFVLFLEKERYPNGGLEFGLTSIDMELVMDSLTLHPNKGQLEVARSAWYPTFGNQKKPLPNLTAKFVRDKFYRGPMLNELDDDLSDEILDYLDERGVNNSFADFMMSQAYYLEQEEYLNWLKLLRKFAD